MELIRGINRTASEVDLLERAGVGRILTEFRDGEPPEVVEELRNSMERVLSSGVREEELAALRLDRAGACNDPRQDGLEMSVWFRQMIDALL
ncbi:MULTISPECIES: contact-dependent growth inhibition system immunity protein [Streptomyces]|uniref:contact-dependent growth inhibition system immunity protein n=1 Tax=Streptomyces TaxID=1883 RepID=UPI003332BFF7